MYVPRILDVNCRVAVSFSLSSFNLVSLDGMERCSLPPIIILGRARLCACVGSKAKWCVCVCVCVIQKDNKILSGATLPILLRECTCGQT